MKHCTYSDILDYYTHLRKVVFEKEYLEIKELCTIKSPWESGSFSFNINHLKNTNNPACDIIHDYLSNIGKNDIMLYKYDEYYVDENDDLNIAIKNKIFSSTLIFKSKYKITNYINEYTKR